MSFATFELWHQGPPYEAWGVSRIDPRTSGRSTRGFGDNVLDAMDYFATLLLGPRCVDCHDPIFGEYENVTAAKMREQGVCFYCLFWREAVAEHGPNVAVIGGERFTICPDRPGGYKPALGHGGAEFRIRFDDGREVVTHNLWAQGQIPNHFRARLPNNARFVRIGEYAGYCGNGSAHAHDEASGSQTSTD